MVERGIRKEPNLVERRIRKELNIVENKEKIIIQQSETINNQQILLDKICSNNPSLCR